MAATTPTIVVHGGAWSIPDDIAEASQAGVKTAAEAGYKVLTSGGSALDAVETAVRILEDDVVFDAGTGSVLNIAGEVEMDAIIMDGRSLRAGSVACVQNIAHPISLARQVMEKTDHTMIVGEGANQFAKELGIPQVPTDQLVTDNARQQLEEYRKYKRAVNELFDSQLSGHDTVGAVAVDSEGNVACATSTGGITAKRVGRVGDSPVIGCGAYADNETGAVSCTGHGEAIMSVTLARTVTFNMEQGANAQAAADKSIAYMKKRVDGTGGVIVVSKEGQTGVSFNTRRMPWAVVRDGTIQFGMNPGENFQNECTKSS